MVTSGLYLVQFASNMIKENDTPKSKNGPDIMEKPTSCTSGDDSDEQYEFNASQRMISPLPVGLHVRNLQVRAAKTERVLVDSFSLDLPAGSLMAVIGGSGSGKTTLLNTLASKISGGLNVEGSVDFIQSCSKEFDGNGVYLEEHESIKTDHENSIGNGENSGKSETASAVMSYVPQQDVLPARLTCREVLLYAADLKVDVSRSVRINLVDQIILELGLSDCANTLVGDQSHKGLSGGEKRRLTIAMQLVANPSIMFLDEPTTGLDAYSAHLVVKTLKKLAVDEKRTFIMSIHQPRSDILFLLDHVCILSKGSVVYNGITERLIPYFEDRGYRVPELVNPVDYFIDLCSIDTRSNDAQEKTSLRLAQLVNSWKDYEKKSLNFHDIIGINGNRVTVHQMRTKKPLLKQIIVLTKRNIQLNISDYPTMIATIIVPLILSSITGWIYYKPDIKTTGGLRTQVSTLYASVILQPYLYLLFDLYRLCEQDIALYDRERAEGTVSALAFMISRKASLFLTDDFLMATNFTVITYFMFGLEANANKFFTQYAVCLLSHEICASIALISVAISRDFSKASLFGNMSFTLYSMGCGFFVNSAHTPVYVRWTKYISYTWYAFGALLSNTFRDRICSDPNDLDSCIGNETIKNFGFPRKWKTLPIWILFCWSIGFFGIAIIILHFNKIDISLQGEVKAKVRKSRDSHQTESQNDISDSNLEETAKMKDLESNALHNPNITVELKNINLDVKLLRVSKNIRGQKLFSHEYKRILDNVSGTFKPGVINAIMGPSGSGKSSLLNYLSGRLSSSLFAKFSFDGIITFNGDQITPEAFGSISSYVSQDDDHLLAKLTVRETFNYAAELRLSYLPMNERYKKTDELIRALGLKHCENTLVGNEFVKGISGGEKRRVTMGIQLLSNTPVLLLDEPTSGLDSFTAASILEVLHKLCTEYGKTIIITIHQPRLELFKEFGNILLLAKGGKTAFQGSPMEMIDHFEKLGYICPPFTNVADFFLDSISISYQSPKETKDSIDRVEKIVKYWETHSNNCHRINFSPNKKDFRLSEEYSGFIKKPANFKLAYTVNLRRQFKTTRRNFDSLMARIAETPGLGAIFTLYFAPLKNDTVGISNRLGLAQESTSIYFVGMLANLAVYPSERDYFYEEHKDRVYGTLPFFLAYFTLELPLSFFGAVIYSVLVVMGCGQPRTAGTLFVNVYCSLLLLICGESIGIMTNTFFKQPGFVVNCVSVLLTIGTQMSGLMSFQMPRVLKGINYINPVWYTSIIFIRFAFPKDLKFTCAREGRNTDGSCILKNGHDVLKAYGLDKRNVNHFLGIAVCVVIIYRVLAYFVLRAKLNWIKW